MNINRFYSYNQISFKQNQPQKLNQPAAKPAVVQQPPAQVQGQQAIPALWMSKKESLYDKGYKEGVMAGFNKGFNDGYEKGLEEGFYKGHQIGYEEGENNIPNSFMASNQIA